MAVSVRNVADNYLRCARIEGDGIDRLFHSAAPPERLVRKMAQHFHEQPNRPSDPHVRAQYLQMAQEAGEQLSCMMDMGVRVRLHRRLGQPYATSRQLCDALDAGEDLLIYPTEQGHGPDGYQDPDNPLLARSAVEIDGKPALHNDVLRATHDYFGHYLIRAPFHLSGELAVAYAHLRMFSPHVHRAVLNEFAGQISWFYYGPHLLREDGSLPRRGEPDWIHPSRRPFADQKVNLMPAELVEEFLEWGQSQNSGMPRLSLNS
ncbi:hypothetical protein ABZV60_35660 [Streptomyces sp. NPDC004787]|uniref:hypothetical protein n=1 Tax=Streptomyces sp. NPDC004787 TaxID=3154291 RepID=UPI00339EDF6F